MNNHPELCLLSQQYNPVAMCLQETHIADVSKVSFKGYTPYHKIDNSHDRASGGSSVLIRNDIIHSPVNINTNLQAVAVKITLSFVFTICSIYAPPNKYIDIKDLEDLLSQIQEPVMILGDFNSHNPLWGSEHLTSLDSRRGALHWNNRAIVGCFFFNEIYIRISAESRPAHWASIGGRCHFIKESSDSHWISAVIGPMIARLSADRTM